MRNILTQSSCIVSVVLNIQLCMTRTDTLYLTLLMSTQFWFFGLKNHFNPFYFKTSEKNVLFFQLLRCFTHKTMLQINTFVSWHFDFCKMYTSSTVFFFSSWPIRTCSSCWRPFGTRGSLASGRWTWCYRYIYLCYQNFYFLIYLNV